MAVYISLSKDVIGKRQLSIQGGHSTKNDYKMTLILLHELYGNFHLLGDDCLQ
jgi:hypothetical protein